MRGQQAVPMLLLSAVLLPAVLLLPGCGHSPNTTFFVLSAVRPDAAPRSTVVERLQLRAVHIPAELDRAERVSRQSGDRLQINQFQQWGAPLADMIRRVLSEDLAARLPAGTVVPPDAPAPPGTRNLALDVQEFVPAANGQVLLQATWTLADRSVRRTGMQRLELRAGASADDEVTAMSRLLGQLADAIVAALSRPPSS